ncbi:hypothetical protein ACFX13_033129 [Malus domestica]
MGLKTKTVAERCDCGHTHSRDFKIFYDVFVGRTSRVGFNLPVEKLENCCWVGEETGRTVNEFCNAEEFAREGK